ncbi:B-cell receptor CD22-like [Alosa sapidissima]|uniref:B-cell receptor CD22-like n=1 Tax=Alosa sapidissima TaxID=34773 RepID=UPI001C0A3268|nr:B-cell receptor CD22-like [Alosa sapidissima]
MNVYVPSGLQVKEEAVAGKQNQTKLTCSTFCDLNSHLQYVWYKNGQTLQDNTKASILLDSTRPFEVNSYHCAVISGGYEAQRSPAACVPDKQCLAVNCSSNYICALLGSTVNISCASKPPREHNIKTAFWFSNNKSSTSPGDLMLDEEYENPVEYLQDRGHFTLRLKDITKSHAGEYGVRMTTEQERIFWGFPRVNLSVTALQVMTSAAVTEGERVTLTCSTTCTLSDHPTFTWFKNSLIHKHTSDKNLHFDPVQEHDSGNYSCAVRGHESVTSTDVFLYVKYAPKRISVSVSTVGDMVEGHSVTLTCSSDANPPIHNFTWYQTVGNDTVVRGAGEMVTFTLSSGDSGLYHCEAQNEVGSQNSTGVEITVAGNTFLTAVVCSATAAVLAVGTFIAVMALVRYQCT